KDADITVSTQAAIGGGDANTIEFTLRDDDTDRLTEAMDDIQEDLEDESDIRKVETSEEDKSQEMQIEIDEEKAMEHGLTHGEIVKSEADKGTETQVENDEEKAIEHGVAQGKISQSVDDITGRQTDASIESEIDCVSDDIIKSSDQDFDNEADLKNLSIPNIE